MALALVLAIFTGATMQRLTGMGFALVCAPFVVLIMGPVTGIVLVNVCGAVASALVIFRVYKYIDFKKYLILAFAALAGVIPGAIILKYIPGAWLQVGVGVVVLISLTMSLRMKSPSKETRLSPMILAGTMSGAMNTTAGVGGPAMSVYAVASKWDQRSFAATMQPYFLTIGVASILAKCLATPGSMPQMEIWTWAAVGVAIVAGLIAGEILAHWIAPHRARSLVVILAYAGATAATVGGIVELA